MARGNDDEKRKKKEQDDKDWEAIRKRREDINNARRQKALEEAAAKEAMERLNDDFLDQEFMRLFDLDAEAARDYLKAAMEADLNDEEALAAYEAWKAAQKAQQGGIIFGPNPEKAGKIIKKNEKAIRNTIKKGKKMSGCRLWALLILAGCGGIMYGMYEGVSAVASALF